MKLLLFLGSGVSYPSGLPSVNELTQSLLNDQWIQHTDGCFYPAGVGPRGLNDPAHILQDFLALLMPHADRSHAMTGRKANYEDLYFLAEQVAEDVRGWADNPAIHPFISELKRQTTQLTNTLHESLGKIANMACEFIRCVVYNRLAKTGDVRGLNLIESLARADSIEKLAIVTVNHDLLIERLLEEKGVGFVDGFGEPVGDVRYFEPSAFGLQTKVRLLKLHGSINWYR